MAGASTEPVAGCGPTGGRAGIGAEPAAGSGPDAGCSARIAARCAFSNRASRRSSRRRNHPLWPSPGSIRITFFVASSRKTPSLLDPPTAVPTSTSGGRAASCATGGGGGLGVGGGAAITGGARGRRDGKKIGRSPVADKAFSGTAHNGLPTGAFAVAPAVAPGSRASLTAGTVSNGSKLKSNHCGYRARANATQAGEREYQ